ncbi:hypothetical protein CVU75_01395 [Candidatus Dependentiae bacterium HGW-Dependentiae-1]|nr:MAG: hypothetical protein CVU75_01395 [Candidatus Dependentiae bacterium HGW-Dependentiae-1]
MKCVQEKRGESVPEHEISILAGARMAEPMELAGHEQVRVHVGEQAHVILCDVLSLSNSLVQRTIVLAAHSHVRYQLCIDAECVQARELSGQKFSVRVQIVLRGQGAGFEGFVRIHGEQEPHVAIELVQEHEAPYTRSLFDVKQVLALGAQSSVRGMIDIGPHAQYARAEQYIRNIVPDSNLGILADKVETGISVCPVGTSCVHRGVHVKPCSQESFSVFMCPTLRVANNTAMVKHGCAVGLLDGEHLFYLCARGVPLERAKRLLIAGFLAWP